MKNRFCGVVYWYIADAVAIAGAITWPRWVPPILTWLCMVAMFACAGRIPVRQRM